ncbi:hypothetical protein Tco_1527530, partial [Tanacetum coccineum]
HGLTLKAGASPWRPRLELCRGMPMYYKGKAGPQDAPADAGSSEHEANRSRNIDDNHDLGTGERRQVPTARECTYSNFLKCQPLQFKGTEGAIRLNQWVEKIELELGLLCERMFPKVSDEVEKYIGGLPDMIQRSVMASKPKNMQKAIEIANDLMDQKVHTFVDLQAENKRKLDDNSKNNQNQQQPFKRKNVARAYTVRPREKKEYRRSKALCPKCNYHHNGQCAPKCNNYKKTGHLARNCRSSAATANNQRAPGVI